jgi:hypothetical protein
MRHGDGLRTERAPRVAVVEESCSATPTRSAGSPMRPRRSSGAEYDGDGDAVFALLLGASSS